MESEFLKYGDEICLYSDSAFGYLTTEGFNSPKLFLQYCSKLHRSHIVNVRNMVFEVVPKLSYDSAKEYKREMKAIKAQHASRKDQASNDTAPQFDLQQLEKFSTLQRRIEQQNIANERWIDKMKGTRVTYGSLVQLRHRDSGMYLQFAKKPSDVDRMSAQIELQSAPSAQRVSFYIQQRYNYRQDGESVVFNDHIILYNAKYNSYLHVHDHGLFDQVNVVQSPSMYRPLSPLRRVNPNEIYKRLEANCSNSFYKWQVISFRQSPHMQGFKADQFIFSGDIVRLKHAETSGYLCHDEQSKKYAGDPAYIRIFKGQDPSDEYTSSQLFEIENHKDMKQETIQNAGNVLEWSDNSVPSMKVRLRHINSGKLLSIVLIDKRNKKGKKIEGKKQMVITLGDNLTASQINKKLDKVCELDEANKFNPTYNSLTDPRVIKFTQGVTSDQVFEIENTITDNNPYLKNQSVVMLRNKFMNPATNKLENLTVSTMHKKVDGDGADGDEAGQQEPDLSMFEGENASNSQIHERSQEMLNGTQMSLGNENRSELGSHFKFKEDVQMEAHEPDPDKFVLMQYDESENFLINPTKIIKDGSMEDVFQIEKVDHNFVKPVLFIHSCIPKIKEFLGNLRFNHKVLTSPYMKEFEELLSGLVFFVLEPTSQKEPLLADTPPISQNQKFLREIKIIDLLIDILIYPFEEGESKLYDLNELTQRSPMTRICQLIYRLLRNCVKGNQFNKFYTAQWISHFFQHSMMTTTQNDLKAGETVDEILAENKKLLERQINMHTLRGIVETCNNSPKSQTFINLLSSLGACNGEKIDTNQDAICQLILYEEEFQNLVIKVEAEKALNGNKYFAIFTEKEYCGEDGSPLRVEIDQMREFFERKRDDSLYQYFVSFINLAGLMCLARNNTGIKEVTKLYDINFSVDCFQNKNIPYLLRANFAKLIISVHIDINPFEQITLPNLTRVWDDIGSGESKMPQTKTAIPPILLGLKIFIRDFFIELKGVQRQYENELNQLVYEVLEIFMKMITLGFYESEAEIIEIIMPAIALLDGSKDFTSKEEEDLINEFEEQVRKAKESPNGKMPEPPKRDKERRYDNATDNQYIFKIKKKIITVLTKVQSFQDDIRLTLFLKAFYKEENEMMMSPSLAEPELHYLQSVLDGHAADSEKEKEIKDKCDEKVLRWMKIAFQSKALDMKHQCEKTLVCILLDIILYKDSVMVNSAFTLLADYFQQKRAIIDCCSEVQILQDDQEVAIYRKVQDTIRELKKEADGNDDWLGLTEEDALRNAVIFIQKLEMLQDLCVFKPDRVFDADDKKKKPAEDGEELLDEEENNEKFEFLNIAQMTEEWDIDDQKVIDEDQQNDEKNQKLMRNLLAYQVPIQIISVHGLEDAEDSNAYLRVIEKCYIFLLQFVRNNRQNQLVILDYIEEFQEDLECGVHAWELVAEVFRNSDKLQTYNLVPIIKRAIKIIEKLPTETHKKTIMLSFLAYFINVNGTPLKENQTLICQEVTPRENLNILFVRDSISDLELYMNEMKLSYSEFMTDTRYHQEIAIPPELCYTIEYLKLLSLCGAGHNSFTESIAAEQMPLNDCIKNLEIADFCYPYKTSLIQFIDNIFFDIEKEVSDDNIQKIKIVIEIIRADLERFIVIQQRVTSTSKGGGAPGAVKRATTVIGTNPEPSEPPDPKEIIVDINKNFNLLGAFGSLPIVTHMEEYVFNAVFIALKHYFLLRLPIKNQDKPSVHKLFNAIQRSVTFCKKDQHFENSWQLFSTVKQIPQLKEFAGDALQNKALNKFRASKQTSKRKIDDGDDMYVSVPILSQAQKLEAYLKSASTSENLLVEFEREFADIVSYIINIEARTEEVFGGVNTINNTELIQSLIKVSDFDSDIEPQLRIICLKVIRQVIELENKKSDQPAIYWNPDDYEIFADEIEEKQKMLIDLGVVHLICNLIDKESQKRIKEEGLLVAVACLLGGNHDSQEEFFNHIRADPSNGFIISLKNMLFDAVQELEITQVARNEAKQKLNMLEKEIEDFQQYHDMSAASNKRELNKKTEQKRVLEEKIKATEMDEQENPASYTTNVLTVKRALDNAFAILKFIQLLCENHNSHLQNILRQQTDENDRLKQNSFDFCNYLAKCLEKFHNLFNNQTFDVVDQLVGTLTELIQGPCRENQISLVDSKILDCAREYISSFTKEQELVPLGFESEEDIDSVGALKSNIITLLTSLLEGEVNMDIVERMSKSLELTVLRERVATIFHRFANKILDDNLSFEDIPLARLGQSLAADSFEDIIPEAFEIYNLLHTLADTIETAKEELQRENMTRDEIKAFDFIRSNMGRIEISIDNNLQRIYFPIKPICKRLSKGTRYKLMQNVDRDSHQSKVEGLLAAAPDLIDEMEHNENLQHQIIVINPARLMALKDMSSIIGLFMNSLYLFYASRNYHYLRLFVPEWVIEAIDILGYLQGSTSLLLIFFYTINRKQIITRKAWREETRNNAEFYKMPSNDERLTVDEMSYEMTHLILMLKGPDAYEFNETGELRFGNFFTWFEYQCITISFFIHDEEFQYQCLYFGISLLGKFSTPIYYSLHLADVINRSPVLQNVMKAIRQNVEQVAATFLLMTILVYLYTTVTFFYISEEMYDYGVNSYDSDVVGENTCKTLVKCFVNMLDDGIRNGGGIGDSTQPVHYNEMTEKYLFKLAHDASFQIVVNIICLNIIFGIIVNSFAELRDARAFADIDMKDFCYICQIERVKFEKHAEGGFVHHIEKDHHLWDYIYYVVHLDRKDSSDYTGVESTVAERYQAEEIDWVPRLKALSLSKYFDEDEGDAEEDQFCQRLQSINIRVNRCVDLLDEVQQKIQKRQKIEAELAKQAEIERNRTQSANNTVLNATTPI